MIGSWSTRCLLLCFAGIALTIMANRSNAQSVVKVQSFMKKYCIDCHGTADPSGDREFQTLNLSSNQLDTQLKLQEIIDQITLGAMPPEDSQQPSSEDRLDAINQATELLSFMREQSTSTGGKSVLRRLSRREYRNTVRDLLAIDMSMFDPTLEFPADNLSKHADNFGDTLVTSGYLLEKYLDAADLCVEKAFALSKPPEMHEWTFNKGFAQQPELKRAHQIAFDHRYLVLYDHPLNSKPEGAYGHLPDLHSGVPCDGVYEVEVLAEALNRKTPYNRKTVLIDLDEPFRMGIRPGDTSLGDMVHTQPIEPKLAEVTIDDDGLKWYKFKIPLDQGFGPRFTFENGQHDVRGSYARVFRNHLETLPEDVRKATGIVAWRNAVIKFGYLPQIRIHEVRIRGPVETQWPTITQKILLDGTEFETAKIRELLDRFASRAYRRPATTAEVDGLIAIYQSRVASGHAPLDAYKDALKAAMCSPAFLYLSPPDDPQDVRISAHSLAERLSYFLTSSMPDERLRSLADQEKLSNRETLQAETKRLLASKASDAFVSDFLDSWLNLRALGSMPPDPIASQIYYTAGLEPEMKQETRLFMRDLIHRNASVLEFLRADYSFVNRDLAKLYGVADQVPTDTANEFRRVTFTNSNRGGLLGQASILTVSANGIETSPVIRGLWMMDNILGSNVPPPPDAVPALDPDVRDAVSIRDQLAKHRESEACNQCHRKFDPLGFALEGFDPIGRTRNFYDAKKSIPIDTSGVLPGGGAFSNAADLRKLLLNRQEFFVRTVANRLLSHALGRRIEAIDRPAIDRIISEIRGDDYPIADLITAVVTSDLFQRH